MKLSTLSLVLAVASIASTASAVPLNYGAFDTRSQGAFSPVATPTNDGDGSLRLQTFDNTSQGKVSVAFYNQPGQSLGTLGSLNQLMVDFLKSSTPATGSTNQFAYRLHMNPSGTAALVWENNYNGNSTVPTDAWQDNFDLATGNFWQRGNGANFNGGSQAVPLNSWVNGQTFSADGTGAAANSIPFNGNSPVYALEVAFGSGVSAFTGYVDDLKIGFAGGNSYTANIAVPEPTTIAALGAASVLGLGRRRRA